MASPKPKVRKVAWVVLGVVMALLLAFGAALGPAVYEHFAEAPDLSAGGLAFQRCLS